MKTEMLTVLLIHPEISRTKYNFVGVIENECLELEYISALLKEKGHSVHLYDGQVEKGTVADKIKKCNPDLVYVCGRTRQENFMLEYCESAKHYRKDIVTVIGGLHAQLCYERMYRDDVDYILTTFDIFKILDVIDYHFREKEVNWDSMDGICFRSADGWKSNPALPFDIKRLPLPDRSYFYEHPNHYRYLELEHAAWVRTAYSCPYRCEFCHRNKMNAGEYVCREIEDVVEEIANIPDENIYIVDDDFLFDTERLKTFIRLVKERGIRKRYICYGRTDFVAGNEALMEELKNIGLYYVLAGLESVEDNYLDSYNKRSNVNNNVKSIEICNRLGIHIMGMFIIDLDYRAKDFKRLYRWIKEHHLKHVAISIYTPEMGLPTYERFKDKLITDNPSHWDYLHVVAKPEHMSVRRYYFNYYKLLIKLFLKAQREGVYDFLDYKDYILSFLKNMVVSKRSNDDE
ncbi:MAG: cobalamin-dependent protein [Lachnospiraceae bacterium]|nr:cobalamin-dependent protein [Lachnospiraceae bacterium]